MVVDSQAFEITFAGRYIDPVYAAQPSRVRFHGLMPKNRFVIAPKE